MASMTTEYRENYARSLTMPDVLKTYPITPRHCLTRSEPDISKYTRPAAKRTTRNSSANILKTIQHEQLMQQAKEVELKYIIDPHLKETQAFIKQTQQRKSIPLPSKQHNLETMLPKRSKTVNFLLKNRKDSIDIGHKNALDNSAIVQSQIDVKKEREEKLKQLEKDSGLLARYHAEQETRSQARRDFEHFTKRRDAMKTGLETQMSIPVVTIPFSYEDSKQVFGLTPTQQVERDEKSRKDWVDRSKHNIDTSYKSLLKQVASSKQLQAEEAAVLEKVHKDMEIDLSNRFRRTRQLHKTGNSILYKQMNMRRSKTASEIKFMRLPSDNTMACKMAELHKRPNARPPSSLWKDWQNHRKLPFMV